MELNSITSSIIVKSVDRAARPEPNDRNDNFRISSAAEQQPASRGGEVDRPQTPEDAPANREAEERPATTADVIQAAAEANAKITPVSAQRISFLVDEDTGKTVVRVIDAETEEVIRQIPPEEFLRRIKILDEIQLPAKGWILDREG
jgi:flagellar protein FlaG